MNVKDQVARIRAILKAGHNHFITCSSCQFTYIPLSAKTEAYCPECGQEHAEAILEVLESDIISERYTASELLKFIE